VLAASGAGLFTGEAVVCIGKNSYTEKQWFEQ
jgi:hypothetical protein